MTSTPFLLKFQDTQPAAPILPPYLSKWWRTLPAVRLRLSVMVSTITAMPLGP